MNDDGDVWAVTDHANNTFLVGPFTMKRRGSTKEIQITTDHVFLRQADRLVHVSTPLIVLEANTRVATHDERVMFHAGAEEVRLKALLEAAGVFVDGAVEKLLNPWVKDIIKQAPELTTLVRTRLVTEIDSLLNLWKKG